MQMYLTSPEADNVIFIKTNLSLKLYFSFILIIWEMTYPTDIERHDTVDTHCVKITKNKVMCLYSFVSFLVRYLEKIILETM